MVFTADIKTIGVPDFGLIHIDPQETAAAFDAYLHTASKLTGVALKDINTNVGVELADSSKATLVDLLAAGMKLFDAIVWLTAGRPKEYPLRLDPTITKEKIPSMHNVARSVFYCFFMLVTQARYPAPKSAAEKPKIPNFLRTIMGMEEEQHYYVEMVCSFNPQKFDPAWAKFVKFEGLGQEVLSRFGLGVAGYRMFSPFGIYPPRDDMKESLRPAFEFAKKVAKAASSWDVHPLTRNPNVLSKRGNLNKNLSNLMLEAFTVAQLEEMEKARLIFRVPVREPAFKEYNQWSADDDITGSALIFK